MVVLFGVAVLVVGAGAFAFTRFVGSGDSEAATVDEPAPVDTTSTTAPTTTLPPTTTTTTSPLPMPAGPPTTSAG